MVANVHEEKTYRIDEFQGTWCVDFFDGMGCFAGRIWEGESLSKDWIGEDTYAILTDELKERGLIPH